MLSRYSGSYASQPQPTIASTSADQQRFRGGDLKLLAAHLNASFGENLDDRVSMRHMIGSADVSSLMAVEDRGGGAGTAAGGIVSGRRNGFHASGGFSLMSNDMDMPSDSLGLLKGTPKSTSTLWPSRPGEASAWARTPRHLTGGL